MGLGLVEYSVESRNPIKTVNGNVCAHEGDRYKTGT